MQHMDKLLLKLYLIELIQIYDKYKEKTKDELSKVEKDFISSIENTQKILKNN